MKKQSKKLDELQKHTDYMAFLKKRLESENFKRNVSQEEYDKTKAKYDKAKLVLKLLMGK